MFNLHIDGLDRVEASYLDLARMSDDQLWAIIQPAADLLKLRMQDSLLRLFKQRTGSLHDSIEVQRKIHRNGAVYALVGPNQKRHPGSSTGKRKSRHSPSSKGGGGGKYAGTNAEIGYILEYGTARIPAKHWMENACAESEEAVRQLLEQGWNTAVDAAGL